MAGKKQDHDCPFSLATTHVVITIFGKTLTQRFYLRVLANQARGIGASSGGGGGGGGCDGEGKPGKVPSPSRVACKKAKPNQA